MTSPLRTWEDGRRGGGPEEGGGERGGRGERRGGGGERGGEGRKGGRVDRIFLLSGRAIGEKTYFFRCLLQEGLVEISY